MCSHHVPKGFPKFASCSQDVPNSASVLSHMVFLPKFTPMYICKLKKSGQRRAHLNIILLLGVQWDASIRGVHNVLQKIGDRPINMALSNQKKKKKKHWARHLSPISPLVVFFFSWWERFCSGAGVYSTLNFQIFYLFLNVNWNFKKNNPNISIIRLASS